MKIEPKTRVSKHVYDIKCFHGCSDSIVGIYYFPDGCVCNDAKLQALCLHHMLRADGNITHGDMLEILRFE